MWSFPGQVADDGVSAQLRCCLLNRLPITERWEVTVTVQNTALMEVPHPNLRLGILHQRMRALPVAQPQLTEVSGMLPRGQQMSIQQRLFPAAAGEE